MQAITVKADELDMWISVLMVVNGNLIVPARRVSELISLEYQQQTLCTHSFDFWFACFFGTIYQTLTEPFQMQIYAVIFGLYAIYRRVFMIAHL